MRNLCLVLLFLFPICVFSQNDFSEKIELDRSTFAFGIGLDYGGWGFSYIGYPYKNIGFFGAGGVVWGSFGYNLGVKARIISDKKTYRMFVKIHSLQKL